MFNDRSCTWLIFELCLVLFVGWTWFLCAVPLVNWVSKVEVIEVEAFVVVIVGLLILRDLRSIIVFNTTLYVCYLFVRIVVFSNEFTSWGQRNRLKKLKPMNYPGLSNIYFLLPHFVCGIDCSALTEGGFEELLSLNFHIFDSPTRTYI